MILSLSIAIQLFSLADGLTDGDRDVASLVINVLPATRQLIKRSIFIAELPVSNPLWGMILP